MDAPPPADDWASQPLPERLASKVWKARCSAYEDLITAFSRSPDADDPVFSPWVRDPDSVRAWALDSNAVAQEKGVDAARALVEFGGIRAARAVRPALVSALVEKALPSTRAGTRTHAQSAILWLAENEDVAGCDELVSTILAGLSAKQPKAVAAAVGTLDMLVAAYGPRQVNARPILARLPDAFGHSDKTVRANASALTITLYTYLGHALDPTLEKLKDIQAKELRAQFESLPTQRAQPTRFLASERPVPASEEASDVDPARAEGADSPADAGAAAADDDPEMDAYDLAEPVDPFSTKAWLSDFDEQIASKKWSERRDALIAAATALKTSPKLSDASSLTPRYDMLVDVCAERIHKDSNIIVVIEAAGCIALLAQGLRSVFGQRYREKVVPALIERLKEKKANVLEALNIALDAVASTTTVGELLPDILTGMKHKTPAVKSESARFLARCLANTRTVPNKADVSPTAEALLTAMGDANPDVREAAAKGLGTLTKLVGERPMNQFLDQLDEIKKEKVKDEYANAKVKAKASAPAKPAPKPAAPAAKAAAKRPTLSSTKPRPPPSASAAPMSPPAPSASPAKPRGPPRLMAKKTAATSAAAPAVSRPSASATQRAPAAAGGSLTAPATDPVKFRYPAEEAEARAQELIPAAMGELIASKVWKERLEGMTQLNVWLDREVEGVESEVLIRGFGKRPGWKESNFQVLSEVYKAIRILAEQSPSFGRSSAALAIPVLCDKLGDIKLKVPAGETLTVLSEKTSFGFVLAQGIPAMAKIKAPKAIADSVAWIDTTLLLFGLAGVDIKGLVAHLVAMLKNSNAAVRTNATKCFGTVARYVGGALTNFTGDLTPQLQATIQAEVEKATSNPPPAPEKFSAELAQPPAVSSGGKAAEQGSAAGGADPLDDLVPRVFVEKVIPHALITASNESGPWKERKAALESIVSALQANERLKGDVPSDLTSALKQRYVDANLQCKMLSVDITARLARGLGAKFEGAARILVQPLAGVLGDAKVPVRAAAVDALTAMSEAAGIAPLIPGLSAALEAKGANPMLKQEVFAFLAAQFEAQDPTSDRGLDLAPLAAPAVHALDDKSAPLRKAAQAALPFIIAKAGWKLVSGQTDSLKAASRNSVTPLLEQARAKVKKVTPPAATPAPGPTPAKAPGKSSLSRGAAAKPVAARAASPPSNPSPPSNSPPAPMRAGGLPAPRAGATGLKAPTSVVSRSLRAPTSRPGSAASGLVKPTGIRRPGSAAVVHAATPAEDDAGAIDVPVITSDEKFKAAREKKDARLPHPWIGADLALRPETATALQAQCEHHLTPTILDAMFSKDHSPERDYLAALTTLIDFFAPLTESGAETDDVPAREDLLDRLVANWDLLAKYATLRLAEGGTSVGLKCLELLDALVDARKAADRQLSEAEAVVLVPTLIGKFGDAKATFRDRVRSIARALPAIYPASKLVARYMDDGLASKNSRTRSECLTEVAYLVNKYGPHVVAPARNLPVVAKQTGDRDAAVRHAALAVLAEAYKVLGDEIHKYTSNLPAKERGMVEERLKRVSAPSKPLDRTASAPRSALASTTATAAAPAAAPTGASSNSAMRSALPAPSRLARPSMLPALAGSGLPRPGPRASALPRPGSSAARGTPVLHSSEGDEREEIRPNTFSSNGHVHALSSVPRPGSGLTRPGSRTGIARPSSGLARPGSGLARPASSFGQAISTGDEGDLDHWLTQALNKDPVVACDALKEVQSAITRNDEAVANMSDRVLGVLTQQVHSAFMPSDEPPELSQLRTQLVLTVGAFFSPDHRGPEGHPFAWDISTDTFQAALTELIQRLMRANSVGADDPLRTYTRPLNSVVLRSFHSVNMNVVYETCFSMLLAATEDFRELSPDILAKRSKYAELIVKCLWKVTKTLPQALEERLVEPSRLLWAIEQQFRAIPREEWRARAADGLPMGDMPSKTFKIILTHIHNDMGEDVLQHMDLIDHPEQSEVYRILMRMINAPDDDESRYSAVSKQTSSSSRHAALSHPASTSHRSHTPQTPVRDPDEDASAELRGIFERISQKDQSRLAIRQLYEFQKRHPLKQASIERSLQNTGPIFQRYIKRALANHAAEDEEASAVEAVNGADALLARESVRTTSSTPAAELYRPHTPRSPSAMSSNSAGRFSAVPHSPSHLGGSPRSSLGESGLAGSRSSAHASNGLGTPRSSLTGEERLAELRARFGRPSTGAP